MSEETPYRPRCRQLCCKSMLVFGEAFESDPDYQGEQTDFWCMQTSQNIGPDGGEVSMAQCTDPERSCFQEY